MRLKDAIDNFMLECRSNRVSGKTLDGYAYALGLFSNFAGPVETVALTPATINQFKLAQLDRKGRSGEPLSSQSVYKYYAVVRTFCRWMRDQRITRECLTDYTKAPRMTKALPDALTMDETRSLLDYVHGAHGFRDFVLFEFFLDTGVRLEEVTGIDLEDVHLDDRFVKVTGKGDKEGIVPIGSSLAVDLHKYITRFRRPKNPKEKALFLNRFGKRLAREGLSMMVRRAMSAAGITGKRGPHKLRHTMATNYLRGGGNLEALRRILRHNDIKTTQIYANLDDQDVIKSYTKNSPLDNLRR